jgi:uncharacterized SAM-binding protein YcdF (DUF218 family)
VDSRFARLAESGRSNYEGVIETLLIAKLWKQRRSRFIASIGILVVLLALGWWFRAPLLRGVANLWIVSEEPARADAIVILGGGIETRSLAATRILVVQPERTEITKLDLIADQAALTRKLLLVENVPESAIELIEPEVTSTVEEAQALTNWAKQHQAHLLLVPTDLFHTRRARWILQRKLKESGTEVRMIAVTPRRYTAANWWQTEAGLLDFQNEMVKFALYRWRF